MPYSKNAFNCSKCPGKAGDGGCPMFWETVHRNMQTGEEKITKSCGFEQLPMYLIEVVRATSSPVAEIGALRSELFEGFGRMRGVMEGLAPRNGQTLLDMKDS